MENISTRILKIIENESISVRRLEQKIGCSNGVLAKCVQKNTDISSIWVSKIIETNPKYNADWLLTGNGEMLKSNNQPIGLIEEPFISNKKIKPANNNEKGSIPLIPIEAMAGFGTGEMQILEYECEHYVVPMFKDAEFLIPVRGSSMYPKYSSGDIVACKKIRIDTFFQWNKVYVIDTVQGALIKRVKRGIDDNQIRLISENEKYEPFEVPRSSINTLAIVVGVIRLE